MVHKHYILSVCKLSSYAKYHVIPFVIRITPFSSVYYFSTQHPAFTPLVYFALLHLFQVDSTWNVLTDHICYDTAWTPYGVHLHQENTF